MAKNYNNLTHDEDLRLLSEIKRLNPSFSLTDSQRRRLREVKSFSQTPNNNQALSVFRQSTQENVSNENIANEKNSPENTTENDAICELRKEIQKIKDDKRSFYTDGYIAGWLKWDLGLNIGKTYFIYLLIDLF